MSIGSSTFLIAIGAILKYAVTETVAGINLRVAGVILMVLGVVGLLLAVLVSARSWWSGYPPPPRDSL